MDFKVGFGSDIGRKRAQNQDHGAAVPELGLFSVSDGMGGHKGGETASALSTETVTSVVREALRARHWDARSVIAQAIETANARIYDKSLHEPKLEGMGTTTTALLFKEDHLYIGHVGDSRCYFFRPGSIWQVTRDHSLVQEKLRAGLITRQELRTDRMKNVITRSVGFEENIEVELYQMAVQKGDCFMLCSDGLSGMIEDHVILQVFQKYFFEGGDIQNTVNQLIAAANANGGEDNITTLVVQVI